MNVVVAHQSPTLFNILARSSAWHMWMSPMGDHEGLAESDLCEVPTWVRERDPRPDLVMVCSPAQLDTAERMFPNAKKLWVIHNGRDRGLLPYDHETRVVGAVAFSRKVCWLQGDRRVPVYFISPAYEARPVWTWEANRLWMMRNRPKVRFDDLDSVISAVCRGLYFEVWGQDQQLGFASAHARVELMGRCSAYMAGLDRAAGFGLAQHECFAAGVPVIGGWWGDLEYEMSSRYWGLRHDLYEMSRAALRVTVDEAGATELSQLGLEYIRRYRTVERMDETVNDMLGKL